MQEKNYQALLVGEKYPELANQSIFFMMNYTDPIWTLFIGFPDITKDEVRELQFGDLQLAYAIINHCLFFIFKIGRIGWCDAPYEPRADGTEHVFPSVASGESAVLNVVVVDTCKGEVKAIRAIGLGNAFTNGLHSVCRDLQKEEFNRSSYNYMVMKTYKKYQTSEKMLREVKPGNTFCLPSE